MSTPALMRRRRPGQAWAAVEGSLTALLALVLVSGAWFNDPHSLSRLGVLLGTWGVAGWLLWRSGLARRRRS